MKTVVEMAQKAEFPAANYLALVCDGDWKALERFASLVRADERSRTWTQEHWTEYERSIAAQEREACLELVYNSPPSDEYESPLAAVYRAIQARNET